MQMNGLKYIIYRYIYLQNNSLKYLIINSDGCDKKNEITLIKICCMSTDNATNNISHQFIKLFSIHITNHYMLSHKKIINKIANIRKTFIQTSKKIYVQGNSKEKQIILLLKTAEHFFTSRFVNNCCVSLNFSR